MDCGMPKVLTVANLFSEKHTHFFQPCRACKPVYLELMKAERMCPACQTVLTGILCLECTCTNTEACTCRECKQAKKK